MVCSCRAGSKIRKLSLTNHNQQVETLSETLSSKHGLPTVVLSIDDLYLPHDKQEALAQAHPNNPLVQHRGQPSTHDVKLGTNLFRALASRQRNVKVPSYDKSAFNGAGDQKPESEWPIVNVDDAGASEIIIFEGWCVGFRALNDQHLRDRWQAAKEQNESRNDYQGRLGKQEFKSIAFINDRLRDYDALTDEFGAFIHMYVRLTFLRQSVANIIQRC